MTTALITQHASHLEQDRRFFRDHPDRRHYIRYMSPVDVADLHAHGVERPTLPRRSVWFTILRQEAPGSRTRRFYGYSPNTAGEGAVKYVKHEIHDVDPIEREVQS